MHRTYETDEITIFWNSDKCRHAKMCVNGYPQVFEFARRPWIIVDGAESARIWKTIDKCPSGALGITYNHDIEVRINADENRSVAYDKGEEIGECDYYIADGECRITHTHVLPEYSGRHIAKRLVYKVFEQAERQGLIIVPVCSYAAKIYSS